ncbi:xylulokinase [Christiangramia crocea]|uniref:Carbohydrate kinase n=1 Tax=Christiangramia crocea TaxID=2904124 RepID=A0A9X2A7B2_9FLAO|nr:FGGY family carbohydrate kinase [Gramella crocea]MCG9972870.1 carbohydrate kinase [Gramella crocea]
MYFLGIDLGTSSIKLSVFDAEAGKEVCAVALPENEMEINAPKFGWAEQDPNLWWSYTKEGLKRIAQDHGFDLKKIQAVGIAYQMHALVITDEKLNPLRPSIIWCDSRAAEIGNKFYEKIGDKECNNSILGSPGNFTASKLKWVKENETDIYEKAAHIMLPGDYIAAKLSGKAQISRSGLSEGTLWNFKEAKLAEEILSKMGLSEKLIPEIVPNFGEQAKIDSKVAEEVGLSEDVQITYRAGDQPNNAFSLNVLKPDEIATTAGTSAVVYTVSDKDSYDENSRINTFLHVNDSEQQKRNGVMLCINGSGILYQWIRKLVSIGNKELISYENLNYTAAKAPPGCEGLRFYPFGNGVERIFRNKKVNSGIENLNFNIHKPEYLIRSACEGIVFAMNYGFDIMKSVGAGGETVKAGKANLFLSPVFRSIFCNTTNTSLELYNTSGAEGAARGAALGYGFYKNEDEAFSNLRILERLDPDPEMVETYHQIYTNWKQHIKIEE